MKTRSKGYVARLDAWAERVGRITEANRGSFDRDPAEFNASEPYWRMLTLTTVLQQHIGIKYKEEFVRNWAAWKWKDSRDLFIHGLLGPARSGTCVSLPVLLIAIGRRLGYPLRMVHAPGHVFCRWDRAEHPRGEWRAKLNIECHGHGMSVYPDEHYRAWPQRWEPGWILEEQLRGTKCMYLRSLEPEEELAASLCQRGHCLEAGNRLGEAHGIYLQAVRLAPFNGAYRQFAAAVERRMWPQQIQTIPSAH